MSITSLPREWPEMVRVEFKTFGPVALLLRKPVATFEQLGGFRVDFRLD